MHKIYSKYHLRCIGKQKLTLKGLYILQIDFCLNFRPLSFDYNDLNPSIPDHLLISNAFTELSRSISVEIPVFLTTLEQKILIAIVQEKQTVQDNRHLV